MSADDETWSGFTAQSRSSQCAFLHHLGQETARLIGQQIQNKNSAAPKIDYAFELWRPIGPVLFLFLRIESERTSSSPWGKPIGCTNKDCPSAKDLLSVLRIWQNKWTRIFENRVVTPCSCSWNRAAPCPHLEVSGSYGPISETLWALWELKSIEMLSYITEETGFLRIFKYPDVQTSMIADPRDLYHISQREFWNTTKPDRSARLYPISIHQYSYKTIMYVVSEYGNSPKPARVILLPVQSAASPRSAIGHVDHLQATTARPWRRLRMPPIIDSAE